MPSVLLVCTANICRSPMAEVILRARLKEAGLESAQPVQSAGARAHPRGGETMDARAAAALQRHDYRPEKKWRSRRVQLEDFERFDLILAMEAQNLDDLRKLCPAPPLQGKLRLLLDFAPGLEGQDVPDPYFGPTQGFDHVLGLIERGVAGLVAASRAGTPLDLR